MTRAKARPPKLPRAVRELLRDVVEWHRVWSTTDGPGGGDLSMHDIAKRAEAIVARARKAGRR